MQIVFVTGYADYVFDGYRVGALDYLIKPVEEEKLQFVINRMRKKMFQEAEYSFVVKNTEGTWRFGYKDILYFYSDKRKVILVTGEGEYPFYDKLDLVAERLNGTFVRIHQRYLVNAENVDHIGNHFVEIKGNKLPISRAYKLSLIHI